jgi:hypothetical protein
VQVEELLDLRLAPGARGRSAIDEIEAGAEATSRAREDDRTNLWVFVRIDQHAAEGAEHRTADSVEALRAVEGQDEDGAVPFGEQLIRPGVDGGGGRLGGRGLAGHWRSSRGSCVSPIVRQPGRSAARRRTARPQDTIPSCSLAFVAGTSSERRATSGERTRSFLRSNGRRPVARRLRAAGGARGSPSAVLHAGSRRNIPTPG